MLSNYPDYKSWLDTFVDKHGYFSVNISDSFFDLSFKKRKHIYRNVLDKFRIPEGNYPSMAYSFCRKCR